MKDESYWKKFWVSGRVEDYLTYAGNPSCDNLKKQTEKVSDYMMGDSHYAGNDICNRDGAKPDACR